MRTRAGHGGKGPLAGAAFVAKSHCAAEYGRDRGKASVAGAGRESHHIRSKIAAIPCPPPMHIVTSA
jgi:hypothetical protein